jgi:hypothetical protein
MPKKLDLVGKRFGKLTVIAECGRKYGAVLWHCQCDCGNYKDAISEELKNGHVKSCGCLKAEATKGQTWRRKDLTGMRFGHLVVVEIAGKENGGNLRWKCVCDCGNFHEASGGNLQKGDVLSCGCKTKELQSKAKKTHGGTHEKLFRVWGHIKERCCNPTHKNFKDYGGRGIGICDEWKNDYKSFRDFCLAHGWQEGLQINRIDNNRDYSPDNVNFVTAKQNSNNRRSSVCVKVRGEVLTISEVAQKYKIPYFTIWRRHKKGWPDDDLIK